uniref:DUF4065 domain-containing protein n=1 Tax=Muribaculaceae bacterium Z82 TaxID=2304548 RepID=A0A7C9NB19_9BACT
MDDVLSVAACALCELGCAATMKLQKTVYYAQAYHLAKYKEPLFSERIEAWVNGPVVPDLFEKHRGKFVVEANFLDEYSKDVSQDAAYVVSHVVACVKDMSGAELSGLVRSECPWLEARKGCVPTMRHGGEITISSIYEYYSSAPAGHPVFAA